MHRFNGELDCPVCGESMQQLEQHIRRKQDQAHRSYRQEKQESKDKLQDQDITQDDSQDNSQESSQDISSKFASHKGKRIEGGQDNSQASSQDDSPDEPWEHDCPGYPDKCEFQDKKQNCPRCGKTLQWGALDV